MPHDSEQHDQHDLLLVVSFAAGDLTDADRDLASVRVATCADCSTLYDDLLAIARATAALPAAARPRDFRLSPEQAERLRPTGWRRFIAAFATPSMAMTRQLGVGLTTLGVAGLLITALPNVQLGMSAGAAASPAPAQALSGSDGSAGAGAEVAPSGASETTVAAPVSGAQASPSTDRVVIPDLSGNPARTSATDGRGAQAFGATAQPDDESTAPAARDLSDRPTTGQQGTSLLLIASVILLAAGISLLLARRFARGITGG